MQSGFSILINLYFSVALKQKRPFRRNGLTSNDCLPYENLRKVVSLRCAALASNDSFSS